MIRSRYERIIKLLCEYKGISTSELYKLLKDKNCKYIFCLLLRKYGYNFNDFQETKPVFNKRTLNYNYKKAQEMFLINKSFREMYFEIEDELRKI
ncbi:ribose-5-phosphate isomerase [Clostridium hydrogenum]|uniref:ribose-5-phosphate isomerase n=1 Tax=Clostridium hydrogenum TaxID=2855764 RepID=UPI001F3DF445|nr:ribose-5-phosphate isomerase [Clostridium hydrogenum]